MSTDSECEVQPIIRAAICVNVGHINMSAILDDSCAINAIHSKVFKRICEEDDDSKTYDNVECIELDLCIDERSVTAIFRVIPELWADMILGEEFFYSVKAHIHLNLRKLKWTCQDELVITDMVENDDNFRALSGGSDVFKIANSSEKEEVESTAPQEESSTSSKKKKKKKKKKSKKNNDPSSSPDLNSINNDLQQLAIDTNTSNSSATKSGKKTEFIKVFIAERELWDMLSGECLAYYGIYSSQANISLVKGEVLERKTKTPLGYHMEALHDAFGEAGDHGVKHLHILSENEEAIKLMIAHQKKYKKYGDMEPEQYPLGLYWPDDFINYYTACYDIPGYESLKFEYVPFTDETHKDMVHARELVEEYIEKTPM